jgi:hypothetical protein
LAQTLAPQAPSVRAAIEKAFPGSTIVTTADVDSGECDPVPGSPGYVPADFDGDGRGDFAVLLKVGETGKVVPWQGKQLKETRYALVMFLDDGLGGFTVKRLHSFVQFWPVMAFIDRVTGKVSGLGDERRGAEITLRDPGVSLVFCGKSAVVYYLKDHQVRTFAVGD